jgi:hypothetical protein
MRDSLFKDDRVGIQPENIIYQVKQVWSTKGIIALFSNGNLSNIM